ncbi:hydroxymethylglutaryl-CoA lyase [Mesorhizobium sp. STM 4661]|uniref:hydroxymethylglutaryl-CoA lyase n=1 Tax=Mesorhizobium sp. STM 4661 TaxID=1297570 RepID=UPI0002BE4579|nr:hydroxymethylglutaryl-CoA lyase [Mesorhizobium sp. STM 4661]CCV15981.1 Hydroxymethylglutaryl-CoA lyase, mitochondrial [Mesorhizobium sp. STM 4661]
MRPSIEPPGRDRQATIVEVGPRDGLQNEKRLVSTGGKLRLIGMLADCGFARIEATAFVSPRWVPQMADHDAVMRGATRRPGLVLSALVPNEQGARAAIAAGARELAVFTSASETFSQRNTNCTIEEGLARFVPVLTLAAEHALPVRGYVSCAVDCPYEGPVEPGATAKIVARLRDLGCAEIAVADTIGKATPERVHAMVEAALEEAEAARLAGHFHDTSGLALANVDAAWELGLRVFDSAAGGLGGCPYAPGAAGNLRSGALVEHFASRGIATGVDRALLAEIENQLAEGAFFSEP